ncbi:uncharacterized protein MAM_01048 [Metarhizium album ARSEF 1941]|uniref:Myb-like domain-containing protein n=1 Tax=Metarhizium album (strain ARSEF 1941) TaxID=1081103 RepID=A0A0B2X0H9_METAS|nr:uncharacterized protein MAM_01048 [Metarhizium album ARSEF 1941]KHO02047.1 hypothetical protein MAM_01048 [Metarhizium album ARSEF 1941]
MPRKAKAAAAAGGEGESPTGLTEGELRFVKAVFDNMTQKPDADWDKVAADLGLKDAKCAKERFRQMSVRHGWREQPASGNPSPRKPGKNGATGPSGDGKVTKRAPRTPRKLKKEEASEEAGEDDEVDLIEGGDDGDVKMEAEQEAEVEQRDEI